MAPGSRTAAVTADYTQQVDELVVKMAHAFQEVVRSSQIQDRASDARSAFQIDVETANIAHNCEMLLRVVSELKVATLVQDTEVAQRDAAALIGSMDADTDRMNETLADITGEASRLLIRLERHFSTSLSMLPPSDGHPDDKPIGENPTSGTTSSATQ